MALSVGNCSKGLYVCRVQLFDAVVKILCNTHTRPQNIHPLYASQENKARGDHINKQRFSHQTKQMSKASKMICANNETTDAAPSGSLIISNI